MCVSLSDTGRTTTYTAPIASTASTASTATTPETPRERRDLLCTYHQVRGPVRIKVKIRRTFLEIDLGDVGGVLNREVVGETDAALQPSNDGVIRSAHVSGSRQSRLHRERSLMGGFVLEKVRFLFLIRLALRISHGLGRWCGCLSLYHCLVRELLSHTSRCDAWAWLVLPLLQQPTRQKSWLCIFFWQRMEDT